jgi:hypothetical protein
VLGGLGAILFQRAAADWHDRQAAGVRLLPLRHFGHQSIAAAATRLGEQQQECFAGLAQRVQRHGATIERRQAKGRRERIERQAWRRWRRTQSEFGFERVQAQQQAAVLAQQMKKGPDPEQHHRS